MVQSDRWDFVCACSGAYLNERLVAESDRYTFSFRYEDSGVILEGSFDPWQVVPNGSGRILHFHTPIRTGKATIKTTSQSFSLDGAAPLVQLQLTYIEGATPGQQQNLVFDVRTVGTGAGDMTPGAVTVLDPDTSGRAGLDPLAKDLLVPALARSLIANRDKLAFVFADVDLIPPADAGWLVPRTLAYAYQQDETDVLGNFGVLGLLENADISGFTRAFDSALLRPEDNYGFLLAGNKFLRHVILPTLPQAFKGSSAAEYRMANGSIVNNGDIHLSRVKVGLIFYHPYINDFNIHIEGDEILTYLSGRCPITGLKDAHIDFSLTVRNRASYDPRLEAISFDAIDKNVTHSTHIPWWERVLGIVTVGILNVVVEAVSLAVEDAVGSRISRSGLQAEALGAFQVSWPGQQSVTLSDGGLQDNFFYRGELRSD